MGGIEDLRRWWWGRWRAVPVMEAVDLFLDSLDPDRTPDDDAPDLDPDDDVLPLSTGVLVLDRVLGGGIRRGTVTVVEADLAAQGDAVVRTVARAVPYPAVIDGEDFYETVAWVLAGAAEVPEVHVLAGELSEREWAQLRTAIGELNRRHLYFSASGSIGALLRTAGRGVDVALVVDLDRFGQPYEVIPRLVAWAEAERIAVLGSMAPGWRPAAGTWRIPGAVRVCMQDHELGGRATLVRADDEDLLAVAHLEVDCLTGRIG